MIWHGAAILVPWRIIAAQSLLPYTTASDSYLTASDSYLSHYTLAKEICL